MDADRCRKILAATLPSLAVEDVRYLAEGWDSAVFVVNGSLLFRFPKRAEVAVTLEREIRLLPELAPTLSVPIPQFIHVVRDRSRYPWTFAGYPLIDGVSADQTAFDEEQAIGVARKIGGFLRRLHAFPTPRAVALGVEPAHVAGGVQPFRRFAAMVHEQVTPLLAASESHRLARWFDEVQAEGVFDFEPVLIHGDLGIEHLLVDPADSSLVGVIDFGDTGTGDPAVDFAGLLVGLGEPAVRAALTAYGRPDDAAILTRAGWYRDMSPLHEVIYGRAIRDQQHIEQGLSRLRRGELLSG
jgi:aminoglycoside 2''-phosphotransferase